MSDGQDIRFRFASFLKSPRAIFLGAAGLFLVLLIFFLYVGSSDVVFAWFEKYEGIELDEIALASFVTLFFLAAAGYWQARHGHEDITRNRELLNIALDSMMDGVALFDKNERLALFNRNYARAVSRIGDRFRLGMTFAEEITALAAQGFYTNAGETWLAERLRKFRALEPVEYQARDNDGRDIWVSVKHYRTHAGGTFLVREDITDRKRMEENLRANERMHGLFIEHAPAALAMFDRDMRYLHVSRRWRTDYGLGERDLRGQSHYDVFPEIPEKWKNVHRRGLAGEVVREEADRFDRADGSVQWLQWEVRPWFDSAGNVGGIVIFSVDITARKRAEADLESSRKLLQTALDSVAGGIALFDKDERLVLYNRGLASNLANFPGALKPGIAFAEFVRTIAAGGGYINADPDWVNERIRKFRALEPVEVHRREPDGSERWHLIRHYRTRDGGTLRVGTDITERKRAEAELESSRHLLQSALDSINDGVALYDENERLVLCNEGYARSLSLIPDLLKPGTTVTEEVEALNERGGYIGVDADWVEKRLRAFRALETTESLQRDKEGIERWIRSMHYRTRDGGTFLVRSDITAHKRAEAELESSRYLLQSALDSITEGVALFDKNERLVLWNESYLNAVSQARDFIKPGITFTELMDHLSKSQHYVDMDEDWVAIRVRNFRALEPVEIHTRALDGREYWANIRHYRTRDGGTFVVRSDVTARKRSEAEVESSRYLLQSALDSITEGVALFDKNERLVLWNDSYVGNRLHLQGFIRAGLTFAEIIEYLNAHGGYLDGGADIVNARLDQFRRLVSIELHVCDPDGRDRWFRINHYRTRDGGTFLVRTDITERKRAEIALESSRQLLQSSLDSITDGVALFDKDERLVLWNEGYIRTSPALGDIVRPGITFTELVTRMTAEGRYRGAGPDWVEKRVRQFRALETVENHMVDPDGKERWARVSVYRTRDGGTFMVRTDITAGKRAEMELESSRGLLQTALEGMHDGVALFDKNERLVLFNREFAHLSTTIRDVIKIGTPFAEMVETLFDQGGYVGKDRKWLEERIRRFRALDSVEFAFRDADGNERYFNFTHHRTRDGGTLLVRQDVTERMSALGEIARARALAEDANAAKTKFLASMSHELRTPLNAILGFAQLVELGVGKMPEAQTREYLGIVLKSSQHLLDLLSNILDFAKIENQEGQKLLAPQSAVDLVRQCLDMVREEARRRGIEIIDRVGVGEADLRFIGNATWARQILLNLLVNAVKYNRSGGTATLTVVRGANDMVRFTVADTGLGIAPEMRDRVFQPFQRLGREAGQIEGAGIGLALARQFVLRMGGNIEFESEHGKGSTFWFDLPAVEDEVERVA